MILFIPRAFKPFHPPYRYRIGTRSVITRCISVMHFHNGADFSPNAIFIEKGEREILQREILFRIRSKKFAKTFANVFKMILDN